MNDALSREADRIAQSIIKLLEHARLRPQMYVAPVNFHAIENFIGGIDVAMRCLEASQISDIRPFREEVERARGYRTPVISLLQLEEQIHLRYPTEEQAVTERIDIEIGAWQLLLDSTRKSQRSA